VTPRATPQTVNLGGKAVAISTVIHDRADRNNITDERDLREGMPQTQAYFARHA
jgi:hypothetical protein